MKFVIILVLLSAFSGINGLSKTINEGYPDQLQCPQNQIIFVDSAEWTYQTLNVKNGFIPNWRNIPILYLFGKLVGLCTYDVTTSVKKMCDGKSDCKIDGHQIRLQSDECNYWMKVTVNYQCVDCSQYENRSKRSLLMITSDENEHERFKRQFTTKTSLCTALALSLNLMMLNNNNRNRCPNTVFLRKHVCGHCVTNNDVVQFAVGVAAYRTARGYAPTNLNSVFIGTPTYRQAGTRCIFNAAVPKYDCFRTGGTWNCALQRNVRATHDLNSGHYDHTQDI